MCRSDFEDARNNVCNLEHDYLQIVSENLRESSSFSSTRQTPPRTRKLFTERTENRIHLRSGSGSTGSQISRPISLDNVEENI